VRKHILIFLFLIIVTIIVVLYGKGYRFGQTEGKPGLSGTGLLVATSQPNGAQIFVNNHLTSATNNTINLAPGEYDVKIVKDGYFPWNKKIKIQREVVSKADALLFITTPKLEGITDSGVANPVIDPSLRQIAFTVASQSARKNGVYILDMTSRPILTLQSASTQIVDDTLDKFSQGIPSWSPDGRQLVATVSSRLGFPTTYLLNTNFNQNPRDVTETLGNVNETWILQRETKERSRIDGLKPVLRNVISQDFKILSWSPDETKILYTASQSANIPTIINPPLIGTDSAPEIRLIQKGSVYVYDIKEDKNFKILDYIPYATRPLPLTWFPDSEHLIFVNDSQINIMEYDAQNKTTVYAGPFVDNYVFPWPDASKIVILTNLGNSNLVPNLYTIGLK